MDGLLIRATTLTDQIHAARACYSFSKNQTGPIPSLAQHTAAEHQPIDWGVVQTTQTAQVLQTTLWSLGVFMAASHGVYMR